MGKIRKAIVIGTAATIGISAAVHNAEKNPPIRSISPKLSTELKGDFADHNAYWEKQRKKQANDKQEHKNKIGKQAASLVLVSRGKDDKGKEYKLKYSCPSPDAQKGEKATVYTPKTPYAGFCKETGVIVITAASVKPIFRQERMHDWRDYVVGLQVALSRNQDEYKDMDMSDERESDAVYRSATCHTGEAVLALAKYKRFVAVGEDLLNKHVPDNQTQHNFYQGRDDGACPTAQDYLSQS